MTWFCSTRVNPEPKFRRLSQVLESLSWAWADHSFVNWGGECLIGFLGELRGEAKQGKWIRKGFESSPGRYRISPHFAVFFPSSPLLPHCAVSTSRKALCRPLSRPRVSDAPLVWLVGPHFSEFSHPQPSQLSLRPLPPKGKMPGQITQLLSWSNLKVNKWRLTEDLQLARYMKRLSLPPWECVWLTFDEWRLRGHPLRACWKEKSTSGLLHSLGGQTLDSLLLTLPMGWSFCTHVCGCLSWRPNKPGLTSPGLGRWAFPLAAQDLSITQRNGDSGDIFAPGPFIPAPLQLLSSRWAWRVPRQRPLSAFWQGQCLQRAASDVGRKELLSLGIKDATSGGQPHQPECDLGQFSSLFWALVSWSVKWDHILTSPGFPDSSVGKESACNAGDLGSIPGLGRSPGEEKGCPLHYSGLENSMDCIFHGVAKSRTLLRSFTQSPDVSVVWAG